MVNCFIYAGNIQVFRNFVKSLLKRFICSNKVEPVAAEADNNQNEEVETVSANNQVERFSNDN